MKKSFLALSVLTLLTACQTGPEVDLNADDHYEVKWNELEDGEYLVQVDNVEAGMVSFCTVEEVRGTPESCFNEYPFAEDAVIQVMEDGELVDATQEKVAAQIDNSVEVMDYYFYVTLLNQEVSIMLQAVDPQDDPILQDPNEPLTNN